jgi:hypothetical protein
MGFALLVDIIQMRSNKKSTPRVETKEHYFKEELKNVKDVV